MAWNWRSDRTPGYLKIAERLGMQFFAKDTNKEILKNLGLFKLFKTGTSRKIENILTIEKENKEISYLLEYSYVLSTGKTTSTVYQHVYVVLLPYKIPSFKIRRQNAFDAIGKWFGLKDIEFQDYDAFNKNYMVSGKDVSSILAFFNRDFIGFLSYEKNWSIESQEHVIIFYKEGKRMNEEMVEPFLQVVRTMGDLLLGKTTLAKMDSIPATKKK